MREVRGPGPAHSWDLATATGQNYLPPDELVAEVDAFARQVVTPEWRDGDTFGAEVVPPAPVAMTDSADVDFSPTVEFAEVIRHITGGQ